MTGFTTPLNMDLHAEKDSIQHHQKNQGFHHAKHTYALAGIQWWEEAAGSITSQVEGRGFPQFNDFCKKSTGIGVPTTMKGDKSITLMKMLKLVGEFAIIVIMFVAGLVLMG